MVLDSTWPRLVGESHHSAGVCVRPGQRQGHPSVAQGKQRDPATQEDRDDGHLDSVYLICEQQRPELYATAEEPNRAVPSFLP